MMSEAEQSRGAGNRAISVSQGAFDQRPLAFENLFFERKTFPGVVRCLSMLGFRVRQCFDHLSRAGD